MLHKIYYETVVENIHIISLFFKISLKKKKRERKGKKRKKGKKKRKKKTGVIQRWEWDEVSEWWSVMGREALDHQQNCESQVQMKWSQPPNPTSTRSRSRATTLLTLSSLCIWFAYTGWYRSAMANFLAQFHTIKNSSDHLVIAGFQSHPPSLIFFYFRYSNLSSIRSWIQCLENRNCFVTYTVRFGFKF